MFIQKIKETSTLSELPKYKNRRKRQFKDRNWQKFQWTENDIEGREIVHSNKKNNYKTNSNADITEEKQKSIKNKRNACVCKCANQFGQKKMRPA